MWRLKQFMPKDSSQGGTLEGKYVDVGDLKLQVRSIIAQGGFSCVYLARDASSGKTYALKHIICNDMESVELVKKEVAVMKALRGHPNVVTLHAQVVYDLGRTKECFLVMEHCTKMLANVLENRGAGFYDEKQVLSMFLDICNAVYAMHCQSPPIAHRDLKVENVLMGPDGLWKLCDFGSTSTNHKHFEKPDEMGIEEDFIRKFTTPSYRAPEMWDLYRRELISEKVDIWALGCLLYRISYLKLAFDGESKLQILNCNYRIPEVPRYTSAITGLIKDMLNPSPDARPDIMQVWQCVNESLPSDLRKVHPDKAPSSNTPLSTHKYSDIDGSSEGGKASISASSGAPYVPRKEAEQRPAETGVVNNHSPKGAFWATQHAQNAKADGSSSRQEKGGRSTTSSPAKVDGPPPRSRYVNNSPPKESSSGSRRNGLLGVIRQSQDSTQYTRSRDVEDVEVEQHDLRQDSDWKFDQEDHGKVPTSSPLGGVPSSIPPRQNPIMVDSAGSSSEPAFTAFEADSNSSMHPRTNDQLKAEVDRLNIALKQVLSDKSVMTSKFEKLTVICRSQRQEIQDLRAALGSGTARNFQPEPTKLQQQQQAGLSQTLDQAIGTQTGTIWDLQEGLSPSTANRQQTQWEAFGNASQQGNFTSPTQGCSPGLNSNSTPASSGLIADRGPWHSSNAGESWKSAQERTPPTSSAFHGSKTHVPLAGISSSSNLSPEQAMNRIQPAGWAGF